MKHEPKVNKTCKHCGHTFTVLACIARNKPCKCCSESCRLKARAGKIVYCVQCNNPVFRQPNELKHRNTYGPFCSHKCYGKWRSENIKGEVCSWWKGGKVVYYQGSWARQRRLAKHRDKFTCQICGKQFPPNSRHLDVHHKIAYQLFPSHNEAHELINLVSLCRPCHNTIHQFSSGPRPT